MREREKNKVGWWGVHTSGKGGLDLHVLPVLVLRAEVKHGQNRRDRDEDRGDGIVHAEARPSAESEHGRLERGRRAQVPFGVEPFRVVVLLLVHVHRPDVRKDDGSLREVVALVIDNVSEHEGGPKWERKSNKMKNKGERVELMRLLITLNYVIFD